MGDLPVQINNIYIVIFYLTNNILGDSIENFILTAMASAHLLQHSGNNTSREENAGTGNKVHF